MIANQVLLAIKNEYIGSVASADPPNVRDLCRKHGADGDTAMKFVQRIARRENWEGHRTVRRDQVSVEIARQDQIMIERVAEDIVAKRAEVLRAALEDVETMMPKIMTQIEAYLDQPSSLDAKELISLARLFMQERSRLVETLSHEVGKTGGVSVSDDPRVALLKDLCLYHEVLDRIDGRGRDMEADVRRAVFDSQQDALEILDAEIVGESEEQ